MNEKDRTFNSLNERQNFGQQNTYGTNCNIVTTTLNVVWIYLFFAVLFEMASLINAYFYVFVLPMGALGMTICFQFISLVTVAQVHAMDVSESPEEQKKYFLKFIVTMCLTYALLDFFVMEILLKHDLILLIFGGALWIP
jgi:hypothetical protein